MKKKIGMCCGPQSQKNAQPMDKNKGNERKGEVFEGFQRKRKLRVFLPCVATFEISLPVTLFWFHF